MNTMLKFKQSENLFIYSLQLLQVISNKIKYVQIKKNIYTINSLLIATQKFLVQFLMYININF